jgi:hypothetical protein
MAKRPWRKERTPSWRATWSSESSKSTVTSARGEGRGCARR